MRKSLKHTSAIFVGLILSIPLAIFGFLAYQNVSTRATDEVPRDVIITDITESSSFISWTTDQPSLGVVEYGTSPSALVFFGPESQKTREHGVELTLLTPNTTHYFQIRVGENTYDNGGVPWTFTTLPTGAEPDEQEDDRLVQPTQPQGETQPTPLPGVTDINLLISQSPVQPTGSQDNPSEDGDLGAPTPTATITPTPSPTLTISCNYEDCRKILQKLNNGCSTADYVRCINRPKLSATPTITPTVTPTITPTP